jgi:membrane protein implicated in regulation of membrane protease activity
MKKIFWIVVVLFFVASLIYTRAVILFSAERDMMVIAFMSVLVSLLDNLHCPPLAIFLIGTLVTLLTLRSDIRRKDSKDYLRNASSLLERVYEVLSDMDKNGRPKNDRMKWLAAARFLRASENISKLITESSHKVIYKEQKEYWRARLRDLIFPNAAEMTGFPEDYYAEKPEHMFVRLDKDRAPLSIYSLAVLYRFIQWPKGFDDPIKDEPKFTKKEIEKMQESGPTGLGSLLAKVEKLRTTKSPTVVADL